MRISQSWEETIGYVAQNRIKGISTPQAIRVSLARGERKEKEVISIEKWICNNLLPALERELIALGHFDGKYPKDMHGSIPKYDYLCELSYEIRRQEFASDIDAILEANI